MAKWPCDYQTLQCSIYHLHFQYCYQLPASFGRANNIVTLYVVIIYCVIILYVAMVMLCCTVEINTYLLTYLLTYYLDHPHNVRQHNRLAASCDVAHPIIVFVFFRAAAGSIILYHVTYLSVPIECVLIMVIFNTKFRCTLLAQAICTSQTSKYVFGVFTYLSYRFHTHMNNRGA